MLLKKNISSLLTLFFLTTINIYSQVYTLNTKKSSLIVYGTSNVHDWEVVAENQKGFISLNITEDKIQIKDLNIKIYSESLKSGKTGMDKNTFKALHTDKYKIIELQYKTTKGIIVSEENTYKIKLEGNLIIAGVTKQILLDFDLKTFDNYLQLTGNKTIKMTDYNIDPPKALFGTIKTGDEITIKFNTQLYK